VSTTRLSDEAIIPKLSIDLEIELSDISEEYVGMIESFAPFGPQNLRPIFLTRNCEVVGTPYRVGNNHLKMRVRKGHSTFNVIGFGFGDMAQVISDKGCLVDLVYAIEFNTYNDITRIQMRLRDIKLTAGDMSPRMN
jgi:single-stranded-DNA-specific exonuclease